MNHGLIAESDALEVDVVAGEMARAYRRMAEFYSTHLDLTAPDADARARGLDKTPEEAAEDTERINARPPDQVSWYDLTRLAERDPKAMWEMWERLKAEARRELAGGHRTAGALEWQGRPWDRARYLAIRDSFRGDGPPPSGIEAALIDSAAEAFSTYLEAKEHHQRMLSVDWEHEETRASEQGKWRPQRISYADAIEQAAREVERAHARFLRAIKMLHELQRAAPALYVAHAGQVNVAHQQVNLSEVASRDESDSTDLPK